MEPHRDAAGGRGGAQLQGLRLLLRVQRQHVSRAKWQGLTSATACLCHGSCMGPLQLPPNALGQPLHCTMIPKPLCQASLHQGCC